MIHDAPEPAYTERELAIYERGRVAGFTAGRIQGISETITAMTDAGRALAKQKPASTQTWTFRDSVAVISFLAFLLTAWGAMVEGLMHGIGLNAVLYGLMAFASATVFVTTAKVRAEA